MPIALIPFPCNDDREIEKILLQWINFLAADQYSEAHAMTYHPDGDDWSVDLMRTIIANYGRPEPRGDGSVFKVTSGVAVHPSISWYNKMDLSDKPWGPTYGQCQFQRHPHALGFVQVNLPLNGEESDLTATFFMYEGQGKIAMQLDEIHVL